MGGGQRCSLDDQAPQRLAHLQPGALSRLVAERGYAPHLGHLVEQRLIRRDRLWPAGEKDRFGRALDAPHQCCQRCSARNGMTGAITRSPWTSPNQSVLSAVSSPSQKRRRERRMYQFERSSTNESKARMTSTVK